MVILYFYHHANRSFLQHCEEIVHPGRDVPAPEESSMPGDVELQVAFDIRWEQGPKVVDVFWICELVRCACEESKRYSDVAWVPLRRGGLAIMRSIFLSGAVIIGPEPSSIQHLLPMLHIQQTSPRRVMSHQHVVSLVIIKRRVRITDILQRISAHFRVSRAEDNP